MVASDAAAAKLDQLEAGSDDRRSSSVFTPKHASQSCLSWDNLNYTSGSKQIIKGVSGNLKNGQLTALMGPSGAGKTSLLNLIAGRANTSGGCTSTGSVRFNGRTINPIKFRKKIAYVMQEDALFATVTPREALIFSAKLRLPKSVPLQEKLDRVESMIERLGLGACADTRIGSVRVRGVSGGERKRTAIGVELVTSPEVVFLDEPTSGLDSSAAYKVVDLLRQLAEDGCSVLCTIHQPSSEVFHLFERVVILAQGQVAYQGQVSGVNKFLASLGKPCPLNYNPADFVIFELQNAQSEGTLNKIFEHHQQQEVKDNVLAICDARSSGSEGGTTNKSDPAATYSSGHHQHSDTSTGTYTDTSDKIEDGNENEMNDRHTKPGLWTQLYLLSERELQSTLRDKPALIAGYGMTIVLNLLFACIFYQAGNPDKGPGAITSHFGALVQLSIGAMFGAAQPMILQFPDERPVFLREYATGTYSSGPYFFSKLVVELPMTLSKSLLTMVIFYWIVDLQGSFFELTMWIFMLSLVASSSAMLLGSATTDPKVAQQLSTLIFVPQILFAGFFVTITQIPVVLRWIQYLCSLKFTINLMLITEFGGDACVGDGAMQAACAGLLEKSEVQEGQWWVYLLVLVALFVGFRLLSLMLLRSRATTFH